MHVSVTFNLLIDLLCFHAWSATHKATRLKNVYAKKFNINFELKSLYSIEWVQRLNACFAV